MRASRRFRWWGLDALIPLMIGLLVLDVVVPMTETGHRALLVAIVLVICGLALAWTERAARSVDTDDLDRLGAYRVLRDTADAPPTQPVVREICPTQEQMPPVERHPAVRSPVGQTMAEDARILT